MYRGNVARPAFASPDGNVDAKQKPRSAFGETQGEAGVLSRLRSKFDEGTFRSYTSFRKRLGTKLCPRGGGDGEAREKLLRLECRSESTTGAVVEDGEVMRKPLRQELEQAPNDLEAHVHANVIGCHVDVNSNAFTLRSGVGTLYQWIVSLLRSFFCTSSSHSTSPSGENVFGHDDTKSDQQRREEARLQRSIIRLKRKDHLSDVDPTNLDTTVFQAIDQSANILDTPIEMPIMPSAEVITNIESEAVAEEMIILNLGGEEVLGGLSLQGYKHVVFSMCPASLVDTDIEGIRGGM